MAWFSNLWKRLFGGNRDAEARPPAQDLPPVEQLETRLVLGVLHGASLADWAADSTNDLDPPGEVLLERHLNQADEILPENQLDQDAEAAGDNDAIPLDDSAQSQPPVPVDNRSADQTSPHLDGALTRESLSHLNGRDDAQTDADANVGEADAALATVRQTAVSTPSGQQNAGQSPVAGESTTANEGRVADSGETGASQPAEMDYASVAALRALGLTLDEHGNADGVADSDAARSGYRAWWTNADEPVVIRYDFRDHNGATNLITEEQQALAVEALQRWSDATGGKIVFEHDTQAPASQIINIGSGDLAAFGHVSGVGGVLGLGGGRVILDAEGNFVATGVAWLDADEHWDNTPDNGDPPDTVDFSTVVSHEIGHTLGYADTNSGSNADIMYTKYTHERDASAVEYAVRNDYFYRTVESGARAEDAYAMNPMTLAAAQLTAAEVTQLLMRASAASASSDAIIAVVDRFGRVLGVRVEAGVTIPAGPTLVFAIDGAIAKARTAALFSNGDPGNGTLAPLTSRTVRFVSQSTITQREVESNPNDSGASAATAAASTTRGPGFVAPIGVGGHFPPEIPFTPLVDLFAIEHTNRDSNLHPGPDGVKGTADDITLRTDGNPAPELELGRFNIDPAFVPAGQGLFAPESWGAGQNSGLLLDAQSRGIATLPGGIPLFRDTNGDGLGDALIGAIGVFFPGPTGYATHEQGFVPGVGQKEAERLNAPRVLEAEYIAYAAAGGSLAAQNLGVPGAKIGVINGVAPVANLDLPFGRLDLVGITLEVYGPLAGKWGVMKLVQRGNQLGVGNPNSGANQTFGNGDVTRAGMVVPEGFLVTPHAGGGLTAADVTTIINQGVIAAKEVRAAVRLPLSSRTRMVFAVTDTTGEVLGLFRMKDATTFSIDVAVAKARNVAYYSDPVDLQAVDQITNRGTAFTNRTFRFLAQPRFPSGIDGTPPAPFSILNDDAINPLTAENAGAPAPVSAFTSVLGNDAFFPMTNFRDPGDPTVVAAAGPVQDVANQNGIVFFPGSTPLYKNGVLVGGLGVSGDGVDQDDVVTAVASFGFQANGNAQRADQTFQRGVRLPYQKFLRNPFG